MKVWVQLAELFGKAHYRENGETPPKLWQVAIASLGDQQIMTGLANLGNDGLRYPANCSMFLEACKRRKPVRALGVTLLPLTDAAKQIEVEKAWRQMERLAGRPLNRDGNNAPGEGTQTA